jgi:hypothetical protein
MGFFVKFGNYIRDYWRPLFAVTYMVIILFDFIIMPLIYSSVYKQASNPEIVQLINKIRPENQVAIVQILVNSTVWHPLTLGENGLFHVAAGAILGAAAWTRGSQLIAQVQTQAQATLNGTNTPAPSPAPQTPTPTPTPAQPATPATPVATKPEVDNPDA